MDQVFGMVQGGSPTGSTWWRRLLSCPREHFYANIKNINPRRTLNVVSDNLDTGSLFHLGLETYYKNKCNEDAAFASIEVIKNEDGYEDTYENVKRMLSSYFLHYNDKNWEIIDVESTLECDEKETGFPWSSRYDLVILDKSISGGALFHVEHKTSRYLDANVIDGYAQDLQVLGQIWLFEKEVDLTQYPPYLGAIVNIVTKHKTTQFSRIPIQPSKDKLIKWEESMKAWWRLSKFYEKEGWPQNFSSCTRKFGKCDFFDVCRFGEGVNHDENTKY